MEYKSSITKKVNSVKTIGVLAIAPLFVILLLNLVSAGFASSFLEEVNGTKYLYVQPGVEQSYFIYPQNLENDTLYVRITIEDVNKTLQNSLKEVYAIPPNTQSDEYKIELKFKVPSDTELGISYPIKYTVLSTSKVDSSGMVQFGPVGYEKSFNVGVRDLGKEESKSYLWLYILLGIVIVILIGGLIYMLIMIMKRKKPMRMSNEIQSREIKKPKNIMRFTNG